MRDQKTIESDTRKIKNLIRSTKVAKSAADLEAESGLPRTVVLDALARLRADGSVLMSGHKRSAGYVKA